MYNLVWLCVRQQLWRATASRVERQVRETRAQTTKIHQEEYVRHLNDCWNRALKKQTQATDWIAVSIKKGSRPYEKLSELAKFLIKERLNPFEFFCFAIDQRRLRRIPPTLDNIATPATVRHFLTYRKYNQYRVSLRLHERTETELLHNQLQIDLVGLVSYVLRKGVVSVGPGDIFLFSVPSKALMILGGHLSVGLGPDEMKYLEDLQFSPDLLALHRKLWNGLLDLEIRKIQSMQHELRKAFGKKLQEIEILLGVLKIK